MNTKILIPLCLAGAVALACGSRSHSDAAVPRAARVATVADTHVARAPKLNADTTTPHIAPAFVVTTHDRALRFNLAIRNEGKKYVELAFPTGQEYDFAVLDGGGKEVYRWGSGRMFTQSRQNRTLDGGDTLHIEEDAKPALAPGSYVAVATLHSSNFPMQQRVAFELR